MYWLLIGHLRLLKSSHNEALKKPLLCEDSSALTIPTSIRTPDIDIAIAVLYDTF